MKRVLLRWISVLALIGVGTGLLGACRSAAPSGSVTQADELKSEEPRLSPLSPDEAQVDALVQGNSAFAFDLYQLLYGAEENAFYSPYSISLALAMTYAGAHGVTEQQMAEVLRYTLGQDGTPAAFNTLDQALASRGQQPDLDEDSRFSLNVANALWGQKGYAFLAAFLDKLAQNYGAGLRLVDYVQDPEASRSTINRWVEEQTEEKIKDLLPLGSITTDTRLVLSNAIYFNAAWLCPFEKSATKDGRFQLPDGNEVVVPMMRQSERMGYAEGSSYQAVELPYAGGEMSMVVLLPAEGSFDEFARALDAQVLQTVLEGMNHEQVMLTMPRFRYESSFRLKDALVQLGMGNAFSDKADFSGMTGNHDLSISDVYHKAFVAVDEDGTEAAAATAVVMKLTAAPGMPVEVTLDRPFVFLIRDIDTGAILFIGHVVNPAG